MLKLCAPTFLRHELCARLIQSVERGTLKPNEYQIIDNGGKSEFEMYVKSHTDLPPNITVVNPGKNLGVAASWNWFLRNNEGYLLISNDDIQVGPNVVETMYNAKLQAEQSSPEFPLVASADVSTYSFFLVHTSIRDSVGFFDEAFYPAYFEDNDFSHRLSLAGFRELRLPGLDLKHERAGTLKEAQKRGFSMLFTHRVPHLRNTLYYIKKWGGPPDRERYRRPFNRYSPIWKRRGGKGR